jgi:hypothetical protein
MPIILAIEPDRRQRDALTAVVRQRVGAELILADTTEHALEAIGNRVPDLVLVPALLSPQDDAALAAALRVIAAAAHVRTLTIPVLAAHTAEAKPSGLLSRWRRGRTESQATDGCDPAVFAEQISAYLKESAAERALRVFDEDDLQDAAPAYAQEFVNGDARASDANVQAGAQTYVTGDGQSYVPFAQADVPSYEQPVAAYAQTDVQPLTEPAASYSQPGAQDYIPTEVETYSESVFATYTPPAAPAYQQPEVPLYSQSDLQDYQQPDAQAFQQPDTQPRAQQDQQPYMPVDAQEESFIVETADYGATGAERDGVSALELDQEENIDLSGELAELEPEESKNTRRDFDTELFDGEPVGVYTMDLEIDGTDVDVNVPDARGSFARAKAEAASEPAFAAEAIAEFEFEADAELDSESLAPFTAPEIDRRHDRDTGVDGEAAFARAFEDEEVAAVPVVQAKASKTVDIDTEDAEPAPTDAEPWAGSLFMAPRSGWPAMEGVPTDHPPAPPALATAEAVAAVAKPSPAKLPALSATRPAPAPAAAEPRQAPAHKRPEWGELVASLRKDIERRRVEPPQEKPKPNTITKTKTKTEAETATPIVVRRSKQPKPIQDEWGFFDPEQCGFAALLAKLDEITDDVEDVEVSQS